MNFQELLSEVFRKIPPIDQGPISYMNSLLGKLICSDLLTTYTSSNVTH